MNNKTWYINIKKELEKYDYKADNSKNIESTTFYKKNKAKYTLKDRRQ